MMANPAADATTHEPNRRYDVFLSFRGEDTRHNFISHLYHALEREGFSIFMDDEGLKIGNQISLSILKAIEESRISIVVLSENYANSTWCLRELVNILECMKKNNQLVWPIFYKVEPSDVRHQQGSYDEAMAKHEQRYGRDSENVQKWRSALREIANLSGWHLTYGYKEFEFIEKIVKSLPKPSLRYDVLLSFIQEDTGYSFTSFLNNALRRERFTTFLAYAGRKGGNQISQTYIKAIEGSRLSIVVFSENYASSSCCLDGLVKILESSESKNQRVCPIFYKLKPSDVRYQINGYDKAMADHENREESEKVMNWRSALFKVANFKGWHLETGYEYKTIQSIVELVNKCLPRCDVFLSFKGQDTRYAFTGHLYNALCQNGLKTFMDDEVLEGGDKISQTLIKTIEESKFSIIVFSKNYAYSSWCLDELVTILDCMKTKNHLVFPIFYKVEPSDVWNLGNCYGAAMAAHENRLGKGSEKVPEWRLALKEVVNLVKKANLKLGLSGQSETEVPNLERWHFKNGDEHDRDEHDMDEHDFIREIVKMVANIYTKSLLECQLE